MANDISIKLKVSKAVGAILGAAYGDALGWPNERAGKSKATEQVPGRLHEFRRWTRRSGGRFFPHQETIENGEYSDDTQLILCLCRSLMRDKTWWDHFTKVELPFWSIYERGGGGATKRAVDSWLDGVEPWSSERKPQDVKRYFDAGGNGVAMRALPHVLRLGGKDFPEIAANIFLDGVATHGHPRALLGALAYAFALWVAFRKESKLAYGELIEELNKNIEVWSALPAPQAIQPKWKTQADAILQGYMKHWESAKVEVLEYLEVCSAAITKGALSFDDDVLEQLQCFNRKISGAGTVAAIAAVYLASRHAADPINGVVKAAFAIGSDTDTIASMTGGLLGCINGTEWLSPIRHEIQDATYLEKCGARLAAGQVDDKISTQPIKRMLIKAWIDDVVATPDALETKLPDQRNAKINRRGNQVGSSGKFNVEFLRFTTEDGQTIYINKISKGNFGGQQTQEVKINSSFLAPRPENQGRNQFLPERLSFGPKLPVSSLEKAVYFYRNLLGLSIKKQLLDAVVFYQGLVLASGSYAKNFPGGGFRTLLYVEVADITEKFKAVSENNIQIVTRLEKWGQSNRQFFRCLDPDGNVIEVFEKQ